MRRYYHGGNRGGWSGAWAMCLFARLKENFACGLIASSVYGRLGANMLTQSHVQIDCIYGIGAAVAEMLLQSHDGTVDILPCLPPSWINGQFSGFRAIGGFEVSVKWRDQKPVCARVTSLQGNRCRLRADGLKSVACDGAVVELVHVGPSRVEFDTELGKTYDVKF